MLGGFMADTSWLRACNQAGFSIMPIAVLAFGLAPNITMAYWAFCPCSWLCYLCAIQFAGGAQGAKIAGPQYGFASGVTLANGHSRLAALPSLLLALLPQYFRPAMPSFFALPASLTGCRFFMDFGQETSMNYSENPAHSLRAEENAGL